MKKPEVVGKESKQTPNTRIVTALVRNYCVHLQTSSLIAFLSVGVRVRRASYICYKARV